MPHRPLYRLIFLVLACVCVRMAAHAQILAGDSVPVSSDSIRRAFDSQPFFGLYKDNYFIFGSAVNHRPTRENTNVKFQISIAQRLTKSVLPFGTYLYLFYTQKCFWNVLENSMPMTDLNFNPGIGLSKPLFVHDNFIGKLTMMVEHESNGRDNEESRSWNKVSFAANIMIDPNLMVHGKFWIPIIDGVNNKDILRYSGIYQIGLQTMSNNKKFNGSVTLVKREGWNFNYNTVVELSMRMWGKANQFLFLQFYNGYGEGLLDYNKFRSQVRVGLQIKPDFFSDF